LGSSGSEEFLIDALDEFGSIAMAEDFLNSGNDQLKDAGERWADEHDYRVTTEWGGFGGSSNPAWGSSY
jgi:hypothetical protein